jgi:hypothetical protein
MKARTLDSKGRTAWKCSAVLVALCAALYPERTAAVGHWVPLAGMAGESIGNMLLLTDGSVMAQQLGGAVWHRLTPSNGSYVNGNWSVQASMKYARNHYSSAMLRDGRVFMIGGEQGTDPGSGDGEIYDPTVGTSGSWTLVATIPPGLWVPSGDCGFCDSSSMLLPNGNVLEQPVFFKSYGTLIYNPGLNTWAAGGTPLIWQDEATWVKLPDDSILTADPDNLHSERYIPALNQWVGDRNVPVNLYANGEEGAGFLLPNGHAFYLGGSGHTALYTPTGTTNMGAWVAGPDIPNNLAIGDGPAAMMVNGKGLCIVGKTVLNGATDGPFYFYEYDYGDTTSSTNGSFVATSTPLNSANGSAFNSTAQSWQFKFLALPDGTVLATFGDYQSGQLYVYQPDTPPVASGKPVIGSIRPNVDGSYHLTGTGLNGISAGAAFGDDGQMDSNYPLVRLTDVGGNVYYARTYNWSSSSVMTGSRLLTTEFALPSAIYQGGGQSYSLVVVGNGIASDPVAFYSPVWVQYGISDPGIGTYARPYNTLARGINGVQAGGTILFKYPGSTPEKPRLATPMTIGAVGGPATIGQ